ncbi:helix-turn-helix domain-containing protein [Niastella sp. OAS944]|uniref:helix-turn-helix domain-containing protein n=1 Tax=Niastella sp. OAS944 TaxID=2664089 RepID=UPI0034822BD7|nr:AraC-like DNA-binding protein [Chitinophagaceae bacterium OAS944]
MNCNASISIIGIDAFNSYKKDFMKEMASLQEIELHPHSIFVMHEKCEKYIAFHKHSKNQLTYVEGGLGYLRLREKLFVIPARHYFWIPAGVEHTITIGNPATVCRTLFFHTLDDAKNEFFTRVGIYPINDLLFQMIKFSGQWNTHILPGGEPYMFLQSIKNILPQISSQILPVALPSTENKRMLSILAFIEENLSESHSLQSIGLRFAISERSLSRFFQSTLHISFLQYLKLLRMSKAFQLIVENEHSLAHVAFLCGYQSLSSFSNTFYQVTQTRPSELLASMHN